NGRKRNFLAGQLVGVEGYVESAATGLLAGLNAWALLGGEAVARPPRATPIAPPPGGAARDAAADHGPRLAHGVRHAPPPQGVPAHERQLRPLPAARPAAA